MLKKIPLGGFLFGVVGAVSLAALFPSLGAADGPLRTGFTTQLAVAVIFFLQGLGLPSETLRQGFLQWRLHLLTQSYIFLAFPLITAGVLLLTRWVLPPDLANLLAGSLGFGFFYLSILPTTISTAVVLVGQANGNVAAAIFNTAIANIFGILWVPFLVAILLTQAGGQAVSPGPLLVSIVTLLLLPFLAGQLLRPFLREWAGRHKSRFTLISNWLIFYMIFVAFARSFEEALWQEFGWATVILSFCLVLALLGTHTLLTSFLAHKTGLSRSDRSCLLFCGSQKTLAAGLPMAGLIFLNTDLHPGLVVLPLMLYHPLQIVLGGFLANHRDQPVEKSG